MRYLHSIDGMCTLDAISTVRCDDSSPVTLGASFGGGARATTERLDLGDAGACVESPYRALHSLGGHATATSRTMTRVHALSRTDCALHEKRSHSSRLLLHSPLANRLSAAPIDPSREPSIDPSIRPRLRSDRHRCRLETTRCRSICTRNGTPTTVRCASHRRARVSAPPSAARRMN